MQYSGVAREHRAVRSHAGLFDVSHMGELWIEGADAIAQADRLVTGDLATLAPHSALYTLSCDAQGRILDDLIVYRVGDQQVLAVCNAANHDKLKRHYAAEVGGHSRLVDRSDETALLAIQGPAACAVVTATLEDNGRLQAMPRFTVLPVRCLDSDVLVARTGYSGEDGFELAVGHRAAPALWERLLERGQAHGLLPVGLGARDTLRLEACLRLYGNDLDETTTPYEAGLGWLVKLAKHDFVGKEALAIIKAKGLTRRLIGFEMVGRGIARAGYSILGPDGTRIGTVTSGGPALSLGKNVGMGYVPIAASKAGTTLGIEIRGKVAEAAVCPTPFYKRNG